MSNMVINKVKAGEYQVIDHDGTEYRIERDYGVGVTIRGWSAFRRVGSTRWTGTAYSGNTLREVLDQMRRAGIAA